MMMDLVMLKEIMFSLFLATCISSNQDDESLGEHLALI
jgi:hypothetical protein